MPNQPDISSASKTGCGSCGVAVICSIRGICKGIKNAFTWNYEDAPRLRAELMLELLGLPIVSIWSTSFYSPLVFPSYHCIIHGNDWAMFAFLIGLLRRQWKTVPCWHFNCFTVSKLIKMPVPCFIFNWFTLFSMEMTVPSWHCNCFTMSASIETDCALFAFKIDSPRRQS